MTEAPGVLPLGAGLADGDLLRALASTVLDPALRGIAVFGGRGCGKSWLVAAIAAWLRHDVELPCVSVPGAADREALVGGLDLDRTLTTGRVAHAPGLLDRAEGGWLTIDDVERFDGRLAMLVKARLERSPGTRLLATCGGESLPDWLDVLPFVVKLGPPGDGGLRPWVGGDADSERARFHADAVHRAWEEVRRRSPIPLARVRLTDADFASLAEVAMAYGVVGARGEVFAVRAARAHAALHGRDRLDQEDFEFATRTILEPRRTSSEAPPPPPPPPEFAPPPPSSEGASEPGPPPKTESSEPPEQRPDEVFEPTPVGSLGDVARWLGRGGEGGGHGGRMARASTERGRQERVQRRRGGRRLAVAETLRRAAAQQSERETRTGLRVAVRAEDLAFRQLRERAGTVFVVAVDASGSMALHRMREAKGVVMELLQASYVHRDAVGLIAFRGRTAEMLLAPTGSIERARRALEVLPTGGGTPLASALTAVVQVAEAERRQKDRPLLALYLTDGRANVASDGSGGRDRAVEELETLTAAYRKAGVASVVIDTSDPYVGRDEAKQLARSLGALCIPLPRSI